MRTAFYRVGVLIAAVAGAVLGVGLTFPLGLFVPPFTVLPLMWLLAGLLAALASAWLGTLLDPSGGKSSLLRVVGITEAAAVVLGLLGIAQSLIPALGQRFPLFAVLPFGVLVLAAAASAATWRSRAPRHSLGRDALTSLGLLGLAVAGAIGSVVLTCSFVPCIP